jgi:AraC-like DNA-binding protein
MFDTPFLSIPSLPLPYYKESGFTRYAPGEQHPNRRGLGIYDLIVVESGVLYMGEEDRQYEIGSGQALLLHPERYHYSVRPCEEETCFYWLHFQTALTQSATHSPYVIRLPQLTTLPFPVQVYQQYKRLIELSTERRSSAFWQEQGILLDILRGLDLSQSERERSRTFTVAEQVEAYIKQNYRSDVNNKRLSAELHFHYNYLTRCMKEVYGVSPMEYLLITRLEQAKSLLLKTDWSVAAIAEYVGFDYAPYFSRCFTARHHISPLQFRKRYSQDE